MIITSCYYFCMELENYLTHIETNASFARKLIVAPSLVSQWKNKVRPIPFERGPQIERESNYQVLRSDMWPDNYLQLWPELANDYMHTLHEEELIYLISRRDETILDLIAKINALEKELAIE